MFENIECGTLIFCTNPFNSICCAVIICDGAKSSFIESGRFCAELWKKWHCGVLCGFTIQKHDLRQGQCDCFSAFSDSMKGYRNCLQSEQTLYEFLWLISIWFQMFILRQSTIIAVICLRWKIKTVHTTDAKWSTDIFLTNANFGVNIVLTKKYT